MCQFLTTLQQIGHSDSVDTLHGVCRHLHWQMRRLFHGFPCELRISGSRLRVDRPGGVAALVNAMGEYDYNNMRFIHVLLKRLKGSFVDVGAHIGAYTLIASEVEQANVIAIEPHPRSFAALTENVRLNKRYNVTCVNVAASCRDGELQLTNEHEPALNRVIEPPTDADGALRVPSSRLETLSRALGLVPDVIKIDVEGHQNAVLEGLGDLRRETKVILIEGGEEPAVKEWMRESDYLGPFFVHFNQRGLSQLKQARPEDPVFIQRTFLAELTEQLPANGTLVPLNGIFDTSMKTEGRSSSAWQ